MKDYIFDSDNAAPVCEQVMRAMQDCNSGTAQAYGEDHLTALLNPAYSDFFEHEVFVFPTPTGTAGNGLAIGTITPTYGTIFCHQKSHIVTTECGAPEFYSGGARMTLLPGKQNKIKENTLQHALREHGIGDVHHMAASTLSLTQATEAGVTYSLDELSTLAMIAHERRMKVHMDGARFTNALLHLGKTPAEMSWKAGIDLLTFGTTKNGTMNAEAVIAFDAEISRVLRFLHKRAGHLASKMRYMSAQLLSYLDNDIWRKNAARANENATRLCAVLQQCPDVEIVHPVHINELFVLLPPGLVEKLESNDFRLRLWSEDEKGRIYRMVMSYCDSEDKMNEFATVCLRYAAAFH